MRFDRVFVESVAYALPQEVITTDSIEASLAPTFQRLGLARGLVEGLTGIRARRFWGEGTAPSQAATLAAQRALAEAGLEPRLLGALISTSVCKDYLEPSTACLVHGNLGLPETCLNFDIGNACLGFLSGISTVANMIEIGQIEAGIVVAGEDSRRVTLSTLAALQSPYTDFQRIRDNLATLTLGSGAAAMVLVHERHARVGHRLIGGVSLAATEFNRLCVGTETSMTTEPAVLLREGVRLAVRTWLGLREILGPRVDRIAEYALHQVGKANHDAVISALGLPADRALRIYPDLANLGAAGVPVTLARCVELGRLRAGEVVALMGIGSGLNCSMMAVEW